MLTRKFLVVNLFTVNESLYKEDMEIMSFEIEELEQQNQPVAVSTAVLVVGGTIVVGGGAGVATGYAVNS